MLKKFMVEIYLTRESSDREDNMEKHLENLRWTPRMVSHLGCIKGCLNYLGMDVSDAWLFGGTGHAFIINICERGV